ncbi:UTP--glucose-1-phosphate uridylyltransferase [Bacillus niameyensis]|uniref:UTP--glucose-1-phosphate uridylyltransferase n=1 Tax=Bacillus niameyensis TaxID=1522308 RepID=UPI0007841A17|nr:UDPGP type 1 family protein [Bacillus niameyensis]
MDNYKLTEEKLKQYGQEHLLSFYEELEENEQDALIKQINSINFAEIEKAFHHLSSTSRKRELTSIGFESVEDLPKLTKEIYAEKGLKLLKENKVAVVLLAGGQGSRLGHDGPKGSVSIDGSPQSSLFALQAKRLQHVEEIIGSKIPWYIMTSPFNDRETKEFFKSNHFFNCDPNQIRFFQQGLIPTINANGKIILESKSTISLAPNGNGGVFDSMEKSGVLKDLQERGIEWLFFNNIDNALVQVADPLFIGFADESGSDISSKSVKKRNPNEKVGVLCLSDGHPAVIEYSELHDEKSKASLVNANIGIHLFRVSFLEKTKDVSLPFHLAHKVIQTIDQNGCTIKPVSPNGYKLEQFYFDIFPYAESMSVLQVQREKEFAPIKNRIGEDSLESVRKMMLSKE